MSLVFAGICTHGPGITARPEAAEPAAYARLTSAYARLRAALEAACPDALVVVAAEHFANFFMNNMPSFAMGMADHYEGPIEEPDWLKIPRTRIRGDAGLSRQLIQHVLHDVDISYCEEWKLDHGTMVPLHFLTPRFDLPIVPVNINCQGPPLTPPHRAWAFGEALRRAADSMSRRIAIIGTGGISHWPCTPDSGRINEAWDRAFLDQWVRNDRNALISRTDAATQRDGGQGGYEIRTHIAVAAAARGQGEVLFYEPISAFACGCPIGRMTVV